MLRGHVFSKQLFAHPIFALFINTFLGGANGVSDNYKNGMAITYSGSNVTIDGGAAIIQGRPVEEDTSTTISVGTDNAYCKLVIEINLDEVNTESEFKQASYKIIKSANSYPALTQTNIVKNNAGVYQYELARFKTSANGISEFQDMRTFLDFESIYDAIQADYGVVLQQLREELQDVEDGSAYLLKTRIVQIENTDLNDYTEEGRYYFDIAYTPTNIPAGVNGWLEVLVKAPYIKQIWYRHGSNNSNDYQTYVRSCTDGQNWSSWKRFAIADEVENCVKKSGDTMTRELAFDNKTEFGAIRKNRTVDGRDYQVAVGVGDNKSARMELIDGVSGTVLSALEARPDGKLYNSKSNSQLIEKGDFAVLTGSMSVSNGYLSATVPYPSGYNKNNCVVLSIMIEGTSGQSPISIGSIFDSSNQLSGSLPTKVRLGNNDIEIESKHIMIAGGTNPTIVQMTSSSNFKLVLMKIS